ncbi:Hypothetical protein LUCI_0786 [Lucifera butyrica]|uniref:Coil containing protein n=1 Tax=Lucifera butyrica TaxID=1351585 RepID=A0A498QZF6_9FIRM|nr:hypothetical protein [Lucifera butyrica]VBB05576.1 Hypothetical protein LUCI_0786 [Lucifera butyrica]
MNLEELLKALGLLPEGQKFVEAIKTILAVKDGEVAKKSNQYKTLTQTLKETEDKLKTVTGHLTKFYDHTGIDDTAEDLDAALEEYIKGITSGKGDGKPAPEIAQLQKDLAKLQRELKKSIEAQTAAEKKAEEETAKRQTSEKNRVLLAALTENKAIKPDQLLKILSDRLKVTDDDSVVFVKEDGEEIKVQDGVKSYLDANPEFMQNYQNPGGGSGGGSSTGGQAGSFGKELAKQVSTQQTQSLQKGREFYFGKGE